MIVHLAILHDPARSQAKQKGEPLQPNKSDLEAFHSFEKA